VAAGRRLTRPGEAAVAFWQGGSVRLRPDKAQREENRREVAGGLKKAVPCAGILLVVCALLLRLPVGGPPVADHFEQSRTQIQSVSQNQGG
jgi:hypothetical protein